MKKKKKSNLEDIRLDNFIKQEFNLKSSEIEKLFKNNLVLLNNKKPKKKGIKIKKNDVVEIEILEQEEIKIPNTLKLEKLYEDEHIMVIDKPEGIAVHHGAGKKDITILDIFLKKYPEVNENIISERKGIVHRLDKETSGVLILAKDERSLKRLQKSFKRREVEKKYYAIVNGSPRFKYNSINKPIKRNYKNRTKFEIGEEDDEKSKEALTYYHVLITRNNFSLLRVEPKTGRTHQIRVHLLYLGNPIIGDKIYSQDKKSEFERMYLHAYSIKFLHPITKNTICVYSPIPESFIKLLFK